LDAFGKGEAARALKLAPYEVKGARKIMNYKGHKGSQRNRINKPL